MPRLNKTLLYCSVVAILVATHVAFATNTSSSGYYSVPLKSADTNGISTWFDHSYPGDKVATKNLTSSTIATSTMTRSDGRQFTGGAAAFATSTSNPTTTCSDYFNGDGCYNGHSGIDFRTFGVTGKDVLAAASGTVGEIGWESPSNQKKGYGYHIWIKHPQYNQSTLYGHMASSSATIAEGAHVNRGDKIGLSSSTGVSTGPHLHFNVFNNTLNSSTASSVDPFGWSGTSTDPWLNFDQGWLWTSSIATSSYTTTSTGIMTASTTWQANQTYIIQGSLTVSSSATLTVQNGAVVKFDSPNTYLQVDGQLRVNGTPTSSVYFTSYKDDDVGGDSNDDASSTTPGVGDWNYIHI